MLSLKRNLSFDMRIGVLKRSHGYEFASSSRWILHPGVMVSFDLLALLQYVELRKLLHCFPWYLVNSEWTQSFYKSLPCSDLGCEILHRRHEACTGLSPDLACPMDMHTVLQMVTPYNNAPQSLCIVCALSCGFPFCTFLLQKLWLSD